MDTDNPRCPSYSLRFYLYQATNPNNNTLIHAIYPSVDSKRTYILYYPDRKRETLHLLHNLQDTIAQVFSPEAVSHYVSHTGITVPGYPHIDARTKSYVRTLIDLTEESPQEVLPSPPASPPPMTNKRHHTGSPVAPPPPPNNGPPP